MLELTITNENVRQIGNKFRTKEGKQAGLSTQDAEAFFLLHGEQLKNKLLKTVTEFVEGKLSEVSAIHPYAD